MFRYLATIISLCLATACVAEPYDSDSSDESTARVEQDLNLAPNPAGDETTKFGDLTTGTGTVEARKCTCDDVGNPQAGEVCDRCEVLHGACWCFYRLKTPSSSED
jgi:hypothetical protein